MQARVMLLQIQEGKIDQLIDVIRGNISPLLHRLEGFHAGFVFTDEATNRALTISLWDSEGEMLASEKCPVYLEQIAKLTVLLREPPTPHHFETAIPARFGTTLEQDGPPRSPCPERPGLPSSRRPYRNGQQQNGAWTPVEPPPGTLQPSEAMALGT
jgi:hypothetical protein